MPRMPWRYLETSARFSEDQVCRYSLTRRLRPGNRKVLFVGYNPSTATADQDDPTIRREVDFAFRWGFDVYTKVNVYAYRSTDPQVLLRTQLSERCGPLNYSWVVCAARDAELVVAAWGANTLTPEAKRVADYVLALEHVKCLGQNKDGSPKHPLYLPKTTALVPVRPR